ncbi:two-component system chemotaxis sensor kinase CheA [Rhodobacter viridis]|uniref:Chemotaxis protein CheA n=1 Tax=Rhodobacter viridis TaxID=1054202 RepID=A0A318TRE5_9RHOB|nr:chemotaxis protein CheA [Rhodobacter viridis]PYF07412.1 two-component system chemotaxis sensor kinase CheA [Rhodobacter viridis]
MNPAAQSYIHEARDLLTQLEQMLLDLETDASPEAIDSVFRALHTLKGGGGMFGFPALSAFVHHFEDAFDRVREGKIGISKPLLDAALEGRDHVIALLDAGGDEAATAELVGSNQARRILAALEGAVAGAPPAVVRLHRWEVSFRPSKGSLRCGMRPDLLLEELRELGECRIRCDVSDLPSLESLDPTLSHLGWVVELTTAQPRAAIETVFVFADDADPRIVQLDLDEEPQIVAATPVTAASAEVVTAPAVATAPAAPAARSGQRSQSLAAQDTVRVPSAKLDSILDQLGELVIAQARLNQTAARLGDSTLEGLVEEVHRLVTGLRDTTLSVRMLPIETVFGKFRRVVRDLSTELGKDVVLVTDGGETEIDKNVLDRLSEPLVHMIRNSADHGIEAAADRVAAGKPAQGRVRLAASQDAGEIVIVIEDDGRGLDHEKIRLKAIERGLLAADARPSEAALAQMIFAPGFSTADKVSSVSGRGVGMDAVLSAITALRGTVEVTSRKGEGTRLTLRLPLSLAIIDGLLVRLGPDVFVLPLIAVEECVEFDVTELTRSSGRRMLRIREHLVPFVDLADALDGTVENDGRRRVVIVRAEGERMGLVVDDILGQHQTVIKPMSAYHADLEDFAGATILADGTVALILDVAMLLRRLGGTGIGLAA